MIQMCIIKIFSVNILLINSICSHNVTSYMNAWCYYYTLFSISFPKAYDKFNSVIRHSFTSFFWQLPNLFCFSSFKFSEITGLICRSSLIRLTSAMITAKCVIFMQIKEIDCSNCKFYFCFVMHRRCYLLISCSGMLLQRLRTAQKFLHTKGPSLMHFVLYLCAISLGGCTSKKSNIWKIK